MSVFCQELQIEKDKHQQLIQRYRTDTEGEAGNLRAEISSLRNAHKSEIAGLHQQIAETKARARGVEDSLRAEISSLKAIIQDLEKRLGKRWLSGYKTHCSIYF